ncbi:hypothetical protein [Cupriavidus sp. AU9028]|uniref:hypothetical protein n=1 Tax=Cupriavidus sp. AU9028 TaxID=2871157 RepID=UPI001C93D218|nr:hypothetical protein [Cupriavidus sp. AU9028]MBY4896624.1 hypothetical protein [Cupriavidus sp. AU9028]
MDSAGFQRNRLMEQIPAEAQRPYSNVAVLARPAATNSVSEPVAPRRVLPDWNDKEVTPWIVLFARKPHW